MIEQRIDVAFNPRLLASRLSDRSGMAFLYSGLQQYGLGRYSILAVEPWKMVVGFSNKIEIRVSGEGPREEDGALFDLLESELELTAHQASGRLPFHGGAIGYLAYEAGKLLERGSFTALPEGLPLARFNVYRSAFVFDHEEETSWFVSERDALLAEDEALIRSATTDTERALPPFKVVSVPKSNFSKEAYMDAVESARCFIREGDVYQVNLSQRFEMDCSGSTFELFSRLSEKNPAPYSAYLDLGDEQIVSSSPERFLKLEGSFATTRPIKGTRPRGRDEAETNEQLESLRNSEKDRSELLMIVDLERNDLGRICKPGSIRVDSLFRLESYATVIHQTADVSGELEEGTAAFKVIRSLFPGGSITGAPKIRSMQLIDQLERGSRGVYTGGIGYLDLAGGVDLNIAIRTLRVADGKLSFQVGGGIVWDSVPESEYLETLVKAKAMVNALGIDESDLFQ